MARVVDNLKAKLQMGALSKSPAAKLWPAGAIILGNPWV